MQPTGKSLRQQRIRAILTYWFTVHWTSVGL